MGSEFLVIQAASSDFERVGRLTFELLDELFPELGYQRDACIATAKALLASESGVWSFIATQSGERDIGVVMLNECSAIYAGGRLLSAQWIRRGRSTAGSKTLVRSGDAPREAHELSMA
jgi:hypothetical protein